MELKNESQAQHSIWVSIALHLLPGIMTGMAFFLLAPTAQHLGLPPFMAQCTANLIVLLPIFFGVMGYQAFREHRTYSLSNVVLYRNRVRAWEYWVYVPLILLATALLFYALTPITNMVQRSLFSWWPADFNLMPDLTPYSRSTLIISYLVNFLVISLLMPIAEEIYFRGFLLPRISRLGGWAIPLHSLLFALFHVWTPWMVVARTVGVIPLIAVAQRKRTIYLGMIAHILVNIPDVLTGVLFILRHK